MAFPLIAAAVAGAGIVSSLFGAAEEKDKAQAAAKQTNALLAKQADAYQRASKFSQQAEKQRLKQMLLDAARTKRNIARQAALARSMALVRASAQGASLGSSSVFGGLFQITGEAGRQTTSVNQNVTIGRNIFEFNKQTAKALSDANRLGTMIGTVQNNYQANQGNFWSSLGQGLLSAAPQLTNLGTSLFGGSSTPWYSTPYGQALTNSSNWTQTGPNTWVGPAFNSV